MSSLNNSSKDSGTNKTETITELARRHMIDPNHTSSDAEIRDAKVEFSENVHEDAAMEELFEEDNKTVFPAFPGEPGVSEKLSDDDTDDRDEDNDRSSPPNPYNVLG
jgi:hypothetical protein